MSVKQLLIDMSTEARAEVRKLLDELEGLNQESAVVLPVDSQDEEKKVEEKSSTDAPEDAPSDENPTS